MEVEGTIELCADIPSLAPTQWDRFVLASGMIIADRSIRIGSVKMGGAEIPGSVPNGIAAGYNAAKAAEMNKKKGVKVGAGVGVVAGEEIMEAAETAKAANAAAGAFMF